MAIGVTGSTLLGALISMLTAAGTAPSTTNQRETASCAYLPATRDLRVRFIEAARPTSKLRIRRRGKAIRIVEIPEAEARPIPVPCTGGQPTVRNTDTVRVSRTRRVDFAQLVLDMSGGPFAARPASRSDGEPEVQFKIDFRPGMGALSIVGGDGADSMTIGQLQHPSKATGLNLNASKGSPDPDVIARGSLDRVAIQAHRGPDRVRSSGGHGFTTPYRGSVAIAGGRGDDVLIGTAGDDELTGGPGHDVIHAGAGSDSIFVRDGVRDRVHCGSGDDFIKSDPHDRLTRCHRP